MTTSCRSGSVHALADGALTALCNPYAVDGSISWHARDVRGWAPMNCYVLSAGDASLLIDTGLSIHEPLVLEQLERVLPADAELEVLLLRQGEFDSMCNLAPIVERFRVARIHGQYADAPDWADFRSEHRLAGLPEDAAMQRVETVVPQSGGGTLRIGRGTQRRELELFVPQLRLLGTYWAYDAVSETLFTSDSFSHVVRRDGAASPIVTDDEPTTTLSELERHLLEGRYWWLPGADLDGIRRDIDEIFGRYRVSRIAPGFGCILEGADVVARHVATLDALLASYTAKDC